MRFRGGGVGHGYMRQVEPWLDSTRWGASWPLFNDREQGQAPIPRGDRNGHGEVSSMRNTEGDSPSGGSGGRTSQAENGGVNEGEAEDPEPPEEEGESADPEQPEEDDDLGDDEEEEGDMEKGREPEGEDEVWDMGVDSDEGDEPEFVSL